MQAEGESGGTAPPESYAIMAEAKARREFEEKMAIVRVRYTYVRKHRYSNFTDEEWEYVLSVCVTRNLDLLSNEIYPEIRDNHRGEREVFFVVGIAALRRMAIESGCHGGADGPIHDYGDSTIPIRTCKTVYRLVQGQRVPFTGEAMWENYYPGPGSSYDEAPEMRLGVCAEASALRQAYNMGGLYVSEEMERFRTSRKTPVAGSVAVISPKEGEPVTHQQLMLALIDLGFNERERSDIVRHFRELMPDDESDAFWVGIFREVVKNPKKFKHRDEAA